MREWIAGQGLLCAGLALICIGLLLRGPSETFICPGPYNLAIIYSVPVSEQDASTQEFLTKCTDSVPLKIEQGG